MTSSHISTSAATGRGASTRNSSRRTSRAATPRIRWEKMRTDQSLYRHNEYDAILRWLDEHMPRWAATQNNDAADNRRNSSWNSVSVDVPRVYRFGWLVDDDGREILRAAATAVHVSQYTGDAEPHIALTTRRADPDGAGGITATERFTLDEAAQLAHTVLAAIDLARGIDDQNGQS